MPYAPSASNGGMILPPFAVGYPMIQALRRPRRPLVATNASTLTLNQPAVTQRLAGKSRSAPAAHFLPSGAQGRRSPHGRLPGHLDRALPAAHLLQSLSLQQGTKSRLLGPIVGPDGWARWLGRAEPIHSVYVARRGWHRGGGRRLILSARCIVSPQRLVRVSRGQTPASGWR